MTTDGRRRFDSSRDNSLSRSGLWCGEASLEAFGVRRRGLARTCWGLVQSHLKAAGYTLVREVAPWQDDPRLGTGEKRPSIGQFVEAHPAGSYLISTAAHIMALRDGRLTDTDWSRGAGRRVQEAFKVSSGMKKECGP